MKATVKIYEKNTNIFITKFETKAVDIRKAVYHFINRSYAKFNVCATETYYEFV